MALIEEWMVVPGYEGKYLISSFGRVQRPARPSNRKRRGMVPMVMLKPENLLGYHRVTLWLRSKPKRFWVHRLVMGSFVGPVPDGKVVAHNNGVRDDNRIANLRYATPRENAMDRHLHGTMPVGEASPFSKLKRRDVEAIRALYKPKTPGRGPGFVATMLGLPLGTVADVCYRKSWA